MGSSALNVLLSSASPEVNLKLKQTDGGKKDLQHINDETKVNRLQPVVFWQSDSGTFFTKLNSSCAKIHLILFYLFDHSTIF